MLVSATENASEVDAVFTPPHVTELTIIVPTLNERDNIGPLMERLEAAVPPDIRLRVVFVDDSTDRTPQVIGDQATRTSCDVTLIHRPASLRIGGLGGAVLTGLKAARSDWICVMDADLQHPPELLGTMINQAYRSNSGTSS